MDFSLLSILALLPIFGVSVTVAVSSADVQHSAPSYGSILFPGLPLATITAAPNSKTVAPLLPRVVTSSTCPPSESWRISQHITCMPASSSGTDSSAHLTAKPIEQLDMSLPSHHKHLDYYSSTTKCFTTSSSTCWIYVGDGPIPNAAMGGFNLFGFQLFGPGSGERIDRRSLGSTPRMTPAPATASLAVASQLLIRRQKLEDSAVKLPEFANSGYAAIISSSAVATTAALPLKPRDTTSSTCPPKESWNIYQNITCLATTSSTQTSSTATPKAFLPQDASFFPINEGNIPRTKCTTTDGTICWITAGNQDIPNAAMGGFNLFGFQLFGRGTGERIDRRSLGSTPRKTPAPATATSAIARAIHGRAQDENSSQAVSGSNFTSTVLACDTRSLSIDRLQKGCLPLLEDVKSNY